ncbi:MAG: hypothetical protein ABJF11_11415 [Reichenbachiella sp.]|uniref:hypothetical protein n=1 Tax=Reichenbachiella sp. TaxID=2184521 RepID=UPI00326358DD
MRKLTFKLDMGMMRFVVCSILMAGCTTLKIQSFGDISVSTLPEDERIAFKIQNISENEVVFPSLSNFYLEMLNSEEWKRIPYTPCPCGVPCARPIPRKLKPNEQTTIYWNYLSRKCKGREAIEETLTKGQFRLRVNYQVREENKISKSEKIWVEFKR